MAATEALRDPAGHTDGNDDDGAIRRIVLVTHYYPEHQGGVEMVAGHIAEGLVAAHPGLELVWYASGDETSRRATQIERRPVRAWNLTEERLGIPYPLWSPLALWRLGRHIRDADVVHLHDCLYVGNVAAWVWAKWHHVPVVVTQHIGMVPYKSRVARTALALANRVGARTVLAGSEVVFISPRVHAYFSQLTNGRVRGRLLPNGVDGRLFRPVDADERARIRERLGWPVDRPVRLFVGRFVEKKGIVFLLQLAGRRPEDLFVFAGWGPVDPAMSALPNVRVLPRQAQADLAALYQAADTFVLPSVGEGFPLVVQEALACGLPSVVSDETADGAPGVVDGLHGAPLAIASWNAVLDGLAPVTEGRCSAIAGGTVVWDWAHLVTHYHELYAASRGRGAPDGNGSRRNRRSWLVR